MGASQLPTRRQLFASVAKLPDPSTELEDCPICQDSCVSPIRLLCGHIYCAACINAWFDRNQNRCPLDHQPQFRPQVSTLRLAVLLDASLSVTALLYYAATVGLLSPQVSTTSPISWAQSLHLGPLLVFEIYTIHTHYRRYRSKGSDWWPNYPSETTTINILCAVSLILNTMRQISFP